MNSIKERMESIIFLSEEKLTLDELSSFFNFTKEKTIEIIRELKEQRRETGINVKIDEDFVYLVTNPKFGEDIKKFYMPELQLKKLTKSTMETLAIIAYKGPITKSEVEAIRGVGIDKPLSNLLEKDLVYISGRRKSIGTPNLYEVTESFYSYMDVESKEELPGFENFKEIKLLNEKEKEKLENKDVEMNNEIK